MSLNTVGGVDITTLVRQSLDDTDSSDYEFSDATLNEWLVHAVREYSNYNPYLKETSIDHVKDQDIYALPSGLIRITECQYRMDFDTGYYEPMEDSALAGFTTYDYEALDLTRRKLRADYDLISKGHWEVITCRASYTSGKWLVVYPAPSASSEDFTIRYTCAHPLSGTDYHTIIPEHASLFADLLTAYALRRRAIKTLKSPLDYDAGQTRLRRGGNIKPLFDMADRIEAQVWNALRKPIIAVG